MTTYRKLSLFCVCVCGGSFVFVSLLLFLHFFLSDGGCGCISLLCIYLSIYVHGSSRNRSDLSVEGNEMTILHNPGLPRVLNRITPQRLELTLMLIKERKKKLRYLGSYLQHYNDRMFLYNAMGGLKGTKFILERHHHRAQFCHPTLHSERYDVRTVKLKGSQFDQLGNFTRNTWDCSIATTNLFQDATFRRHLTSVHKDEAIALLEGWGVKYVLLDEIRKPTVQDSIYVRHHLYAHKFPYIPDPVTNAYYGDADWKWKGNQKIDYKEHGAETKDDRNAFRSLWSFAPKAVSSASGLETKRSASPERPKTPKNLKKEK